MQENGVPMTFAYISDAHDNHTLGRASQAPVRPATRPAESYDDAFATFFQRLPTTASTSRTRSSSSPSTRATTSPAERAARPGECRARSSTTTPCLTPTSLPGEPDRRGQRRTSTRPARGTSRLRHPLRRRPDVLRQRPAGADEPGVAEARAGRRRRDAARPVQGRGTDTDRLPARRHGRGERAAHGQLRSEADTVVHDVRRRRLLLPDRERLQGTVRPIRACAECVNPGFAWNHGDSQDEIGNTWFGMVGPGVDKRGIDNTTWTDHVDLRPTINALLGLHDNYLDDGRVVTRDPGPQGNPAAARLGGRITEDLGNAYKQINAPFGQFATDTLVASTAALKTSDALKYDSIEASIANLTVTSECAGRRRSGRR